MTRNTTVLGLRLTGIAVMTVALAACTASKSADPLSPSVAGPIPGVNISAPRTMQPSGGARVAVDQQPVTLTVANASTSGVRPLNYLFEIATDTNFTSKVFSREGIAPGENGQTSLRLPDPLATGHTYYWRARAQDGANTGSYSSPSDFSVYTPVVFSTPGPITPVNNVVVGSLRPRFSFNNAPRTGPAGAVTYTVEVSDTSSFGTTASANVSEQAGTTNLDPPQDLPANKQLFWHVRAFDSNSVGPWSETQVFRTPAAGGGGGGGGGGVVGPPVGPAPNDAINLNQVGVYNSPSDVAGWSVTSTITQLTMSPSSGLSFEFTTKNSWPDYTPPGWDGPLQYTVWAVVRIGGQWYTSGFIQMWRGRASTGAPILSDFAKNWAYDARWGPMMGHQPQVGEQMGFFLTAGDARGNCCVTSLRERTNVILVSLPAGDSGTFSTGVARLFGGR